MNLPQNCCSFWQNIDKTSTDINHHKVKIATGEKMMKKLIKGIEDSKKEKEKLSQDKEKLMITFKEIEQKAFKVQENYKKTQQVAGFDSLFGSQVSDHLAKHMHMIIK